MPKYQVPAMIENDNGVMTFSSVDGKPRPILVHGRTEAVFVSERDASKMNDVQLRMFSASFLDKVACAGSVDDIRPGQYAADELRQELGFLFTEDGDFAYGGKSFRRVTCTLKDAKGNPMDFVSYQCT